MSETENEHSQLEQPAVQSRRTWVRGLLLGATLLVLGGVIGSSLTVMAINRQRDAERREGPNIPERLVRRLTSEMDLSAKQTEQIHAIVSEHHEAIRRLHEEMRPLAQNEMRAMKEEIASVLTPDQRTHWERRWKEMSEKMRKRREQERDRRGDGPRYRNPDGSPRRERGPR